MRIRCECCREFITVDHDESVNFGSEAVVGPLGPDEVRQVVSFSEGHTCPHCEKGRFFVATVELTHLTADELKDLERFLLRFQQRVERARLRAEEEE